MNSLSIWEQNGLIASIERDNGGIPVTVSLYFFVIALQDSICWVQDLVTALHEGSIPGRGPGDKLPVNGSSNAHIVGRNDLRQQTNPLQQS